MTHEERVRYQLLALQAMLDTWLRRAVFGEKAIVRVDQLYWY